MKRYSAAYIIAFHFCSDISDISSCRYQSTRYVNPAIYTIGDDYYCAPSSNKPPKHIFGKAWELIGEHYGRKIFVSRIA